MWFEKNLLMITRLFLFMVVFVLVGLCINEPLNINSHEININGSRKVVGVGVILDFDSRVGEISKDYISAALSDFYAKHADYQTRLALSVKDSKNDVVFAASVGKCLYFNKNSAKKFRENRRNI